VVAVAKAAPIQNNIEKGKEEKVHCKKLVAALDIKKINNRKVFFVAIFPPTMSDKPTSNKMKIFIFLLVLYYSSASYDTTRS